LRFATGEASKTFQIPIANDGYVEGAEVFTIALSNVTGVHSDSSDDSDDTDDDTRQRTGHNPYLNNSFFVRMHYVDFLSANRTRLASTTGSDAQRLWHAAWFPGSERPAAATGAHICEGLLFFGANGVHRRGFPGLSLYDVGLKQAAALYGVTIRIQRSCEVSDYRRPSKRRPE